MKKLFPMTLILAMTLQTSHLTAGNTQIKPKERTIGELLNDKSAESNNHLKNYFIQNKQLINSRSTKEIKNKNDNPIGLPIYLALLYDNHEMINWLLDNGAELSNDIFITLFLQKAVTCKNKKFNTHLKNLLDNKPGIIQQKMSFDGQKLTPLAYAESVNNQEAIEYMQNLINKN